jgi:hypothetical protein
MKELFGLLDVQRRITDHYVLIGIRDNRECYHSDSMSASFADEVSTKVGMMIRCEKVMLSVCWAVNGDVAVDWM